MCYLQGTHVLQSSLQTAPCSDQPTSLCRTAAHSATPAIRVPTACDTDCHKHLMAGHSSPMPPQSARTAIQLILDQPASCAMAQERLSSPAIEAESQHFLRADNADAVSRVVHQAASLAVTGAADRLPGVISAGMPVGSSVKGPSHANSPMLPCAAHPQSIVADVCKVHSTSTNPQRLPTATDTPFTEQWPARAVVTYMPDSTPSESSATAEIAAEPPVGTTQAMECLTGEGSATRLQGRGWHPTDRKEPLPPQPSSIFGSPEASVSEDHGEAALHTSSASLDSTVASSESAQPQSYHTLLHQQSKAGSPFSAPRAPPGHPQASTPYLDSACASSFDRTPSSTDAASAINHGITVSRAQANSPPSGWSSSSVLQASSSSVLPASPDPDYVVAAHSGSDSTGLPMVCPLLDASVAEMVSPGLLAPDVMEVISRQGAPCDTSWLAARMSAPQRQESSSGR